jgi:hypothetical protein
MQMMPMLLRTGACLRRVMLLYGLVSNFVWGSSAEQAAGSAPAAATVAGVAADASANERATPRRSPRRAKRA